MSSFLTLRSPLLPAPIASRSFYVDDKGVFTVSGIPEGDYLLEIARRQVAADVIFGDPEHLFVRRSLHLDRDLQDLEVSLNGGARVEGFLDVEGASGAGLFLTIELAMVDGDEVLRAEHTSRRDGRFAFPSVKPGRYMLAVWDEGELKLKSMRAGGRDLTDRVIEIGSESMSDLRLTLSRDAVTLVTGTVRDASGRPLRSGHVIAISTDPEKRVLARGARGLQDWAILRGSTFKLRLPAGDYVILAMTTTDLGDWPAPDAVERLSHLAAPVTVGPGETQTLNLTMTTIAKR